jgi:hypothetical protein
MTDIEIRPRAFLIGWLVGGVLVYPIVVMIFAALWGGLALVFSSFYRPGTSGVIDFIGAVGGVLLSGAAIGFSLGAVQRWLLRRYLCWTADGWRRYSIIGGALGAGVAALAYGFARALIYRRTGYYPGSMDMAAMVLMPLFIGIVSVLQWMTLRYAVKQALLWVLANVVGGLIFSGMLWINAPRMDSDASWIAAFIAVLGQAFVTGIVMLWLFEKLAYPIQDVDDVEPLTNINPNRPRSVWDEAI